MENTENIFAIPVIDQHMVYNPLNGRYALLNESGITLLKDALNESNTTSLPEDFQELADFLTASGVQHPEKTGPVSPQFLGIIPSRKCNMACAYCDFGTHHNTGERLDPKLMVSAIDWFAEKKKGEGQKQLSIQFFGGEPFVELELLDIAIHHARFLGSRLGLIPQFEALSNGYFNMVQRRFVKDYFDRIIISLDGFQQYHDKARAASGNRSSFSKVVETLHYLSKQNIELSIRCCITSDSVNEMEAIAEWFCVEFKPDKVNFETLTENSFTKSAGLQPPDPYLFAKHCLNSWDVLEKHGVEPAYAPVSLNQPQTTSCPVGRDVVIIHPSGSLASCYVQENDWISKGMNLTIGKVTGNNVTLDEQNISILRNQLDNKSRCVDCFCRYGCAGGCHVNNTYPDSSTSYVNYCIHTRIITLCSLLKEIGENDLIEELLNSQSHMERLANQKSDKLLDVEN